MKNDKLSQIFTKNPETIIFSQKWLNNNGISRQLVSIYCKNRRLNKIGRGLYVIPGHTPEWYDFIDILQSQLNTKSHIGGITALALHGYIPLSDITSLKHIEVYTNKINHLPKWIIDIKTKEQFIHIKTNILKDNDLGLTLYNVNNTEITISTPERAVLELIERLPNKIHFSAIHILISKLKKINIKTLQALLNDCTSINVNRYFLFVADHIDHEWFKYIDFSQFDLGVGKRYIAPNAIFNEKYKITVPEFYIDNIKNQVHRT